MRLGWNIVPARSAASEPIELAGARRGRASLALFGLFGCGNLGNDGSLEAMIAFLRHARPEARLVCICSQPRIVAAQTGLEALPIRRSRQLTAATSRLDRLLLRLPSRVLDLASLRRHLRGTEALIVPGTGILDDFGERPYGMPLDLFLWCFAARLLGVRVALVSIGAGPIRHPLSRRLMLAAARCAHYRSYRDEMSREYMESNGINTNSDRVYPDLAFGLAEPAPVPRPGPEAELAVGVGVMSYYGWYRFATGGPAIFEKYLARMTAFILHLLDAGHRVRLLTGETGDETALDRIRGAVGAALSDKLARISAAPIASLRDLMVQIAQTDIVVATRFHNIVCAFKMNKPAISLGYSRKNDVLMAQMGLGAFCHHVEHFDPATLVVQVAALSAAHADYERRIAARRDELRAELKDQEARLMAEILRVEPDAVA